MRFYTNQHKFYCGIDLHARSMYLCILDQEGKTMLHRNCRATPDDFLRAVQPYREDVVVAVECMFVWYWLADLCTQEAIPFVLGHALYETFEFSKIWLGSHFLPDFSKNRDLVEDITSRC